jgi:N-acetylmuramic acid 6-phosphate (MurNAc-6-P) etherase
MTNLILTLAIITFGTLFGMCLISLRNVELENKKLRKENTELIYSKIKV